MKYQGNFWIKIDIFLRMFKIILLFMFSATVLCFGFYEDEIPCGYLRNGIADISGKGILESPTAYEVWFSCFVLLHAYKLLRQILLIMEQVVAPRPWMAHILPVEGGLPCSGAIITRSHIISTSVCICYRAKLCRKKVQMGKVPL